MNTENAVIEAPAVEAPNALEQTAAPADEAPKQEGEQEPQTEEKTKAEKTPEQREIDRLRRAIDRKTRQLYEARARSNLTPQPVAANNQDSNDDSAPLSLTRAELAEIVRAEAAKLAPRISEEQAEVQRRQSVVQGLAKTWGQERFDELSQDLNDAFDGLQDASGKPKPAIEAVFEADEPAKVIEWLADPENADEAERISKLPAVQAGKAIAKLETRLSTEKPKPKAQISKAPTPLEPVRGEGNSSSVAPDPSNTKAWIRWRNEQERKGL